MKAWHDEVEQPDDVVLIVKQLMHSIRSSQKPLVLAPAYLHVNLGGLAPKGCRSRCEISDRAAKEYSKTAVAIVTAPWVMTRASAWLDDLVRRRGSPADPDALPSIDFIRYGIRECRPLMPHDVQDVYSFAPRTPNMIEVEVVAKRRRLNNKTQVSSGGLAKAAPRDRKRKSPAEAAVLAAGAVAAAPAVEPGAPAAAAAAAAADATAARQLGCSKCRCSARGCQKCKTRLAAVLVVELAPPAEELMPAEVSAEELVPPEHGHTHRTLPMHGMSYHIWVVQ